MNTELVKYIRNKKNQPVGVVLATVVSEEGKDVVGLGWSLCCKKDKFNKERGLTIARGRAMTGTDTQPPHQIFPELMHIANRGMKYFKKGIGDYNPLLINPD